MSIHGRFTPKNPHKYVGDSGNIVFRSAWERTFMEYCDRREEVLRWASEELQIPYFFPNDGKWHRYYPDFLVNVLTKEGQKQTWIVEIKPNRQTRPPKAIAPRSRRVKLYEALEYAKNQAKWRAAEAYCHNKGWKFVILTEKDLYPRV